MRRHVGTYAVPGPIDRPSSDGCNELIRQGASLVTDGSHIVEDLSLLPLPATPDEPAARGVPYKGITNLRPESQAAVKAFMVKNKVLLESAK